MSIKRVFLCGLVLSLVTVGLVCAKRVNLDDGDLLDIIDEEPIVARRQPASVEKPSSSQSSKAV